MLYLWAHRYEDLSTSVGLITIALMLTLLVQKEVMRVRGTAASMPAVRMVDILLVPLLFVFGLILVGRYFVLRYS
jgi:hypothetical protein